MNLLLELEKIAENDLIFCKYMPLFEKKLLETMNETINNIIKIKNAHYKEPNYTYPKFIKYAALGLNINFSLSPEQNYKNAVINWGLSKEDNFKDRKEIK